MSTWQSLHYLNLLWLLLPMAALFLFAARRRQAILKRVAAPAQQKNWTRTANPAARFFKALLLILAMAACIIALARPSWNKKKQPFKAQGRDVVFILDISRSMLAAHRNTTRLEEAKFAIQECLATVRGDRVALIIFAGNAKIACPLTHDYAYFLAKLNDVDYRSVTFGGTMLGDAIRLACNGIFKAKAQLYRDVLVITDGEDMQSNPIQAAEQLAELNARLIAVGMGDDTPRPLVITTPDGASETVMDNGTPVQTRLDAETLQKMTEATPGGIFIPVPSDTMLNLNDIYKKHIELQLKKDFDTHSVVTYEEKYQFFLVFALVFLTIMQLLPDRRKALVLLAAIACLDMSAHAAEDNVTDLVNLSRKLIEDGDCDKAKDILKQALERQPDNPVALFNLADINYREQNFQDALNGFQRALTLASAQKESDTALVEKLNLAVAAAAFQLSRQQENQNAKDDARLAVKHYKRALDLNPQNPQTQPNLKTAKLNYKTILKKLQQQPRENSQDNGGKDDQKDDDGDKQQDEQKQGGGQKQQDEQKQQQDSLQDLEQQQRQAAQDMKDGSKDQKGLEHQQQQLQSQTQDALDKQRQLDAAQQNTQSKAQDFLQQSAQKQQEAAEHLKNNDKDAAQQAQKDAADFTQMAQQALKDPPEKQQPQPQQQQQAQEQQAQQKQVQQPPRQDDARAMDAINMENINRLKRQQHSFTIPSAQNKDW